MADKFIEEAEQECQKAEEFLAKTIGYEDEDWHRCGVLLKGYMSLHTFEGADVPLWQPDMNLKQRREYFIKAHDVCKRSVNDPTWPVILNPETGEPVCKPFFWNVCEIHGGRLQASVLAAEAATAAKLNLDRLKAMQEQVRKRKPLSSESESESESDTDSESSESESERRDTRAPKKRRYSKNSKGRREQIEKAKSAMKARDLEGGRTTERESRDEEQDDRQRRKQGEQQRLENRQDGEDQDERRGSKDGEKKKKKKKKKKNKADNKGKDVESDDDEHAENKGPKLYYWETSKDFSTEECRLTESLSQQYIRRALQTAGIVTTRHLLDYYNSTKDMLQDCGKVSEGRKEVQAILLQAIRLPMTFNPVNPDDVSDSEEQLKEEKKEKRKASQLPGTVPAILQGQLGKYQQALNAKIAALKLLESHLFKTWKCTAMLEKVLAEKKEAQTMQQRLMAMANAGPKAANKAWSSLKQMCTLGLTAVVSDDAAYGDVITEMIMRDVYPDSDEPKGAGAKRTFA